MQVAVTKIRLGMEARVHRRAALAEITATIFLAGSIAVHYALSIGVALHFNGDFSVAC